jgi:hypothetical protein
MRYIVGSECGFYQNHNRRPSWVGKLADAKQFTSLRSAEHIVRILERSHIKATVIKLPGNTKRES